MEKNRDIFGLSGPHKNPADVEERKKSKKPNPLAEEKEPKTPPVSEATEESAGKAVSEASEESPAKKFAKGVKMAAIESLTHPLGVQLGEHIAHKMFGVAVKKAAKDQAKELATESVGAAETAKFIKEKHLDKREEE